MNTIETNGVAKVQELSNAELDGVSGGATTNTAASDSELKDSELNSVTGGTSDFIRACARAIERAITLNSGPGPDLNDDTLRPFGERA